MADAGILTGPEIEKQIAAGRIHIDPFNPKHVSCGSVDLTLGDRVTLYTGTFSDSRKEPSVDGRTFAPVASVVKKNPELIWDSRAPWPTETRVIHPEIGWVVKPGICYLLHTVERVWTDEYIPIIDGKSSVGRAFILVHYTAGYGDPGFNGQYTLEVTSQIPIRLYPGMKICQVRFHTMVGEPRLYSGHYRGEHARGAVGTRLHESAHARRPRPVRDDGDLQAELLDALDT